VTNLVVLPASILVVNIGADSRLTGNNRRWTVRDLVDLEEYHRVLDMWPREVAKPKS
jgi:hypothetical protein